MVARVFRRCRAFSLLEVVIATGIVAVGVTVVLAMLAASMKNPSGAGGVAGATAMADAIQNKLQRRADVNGWDALIAEIPVMNADPQVSLHWVATRQSDDLRVLAAGESPERDRYYLIEIRRFSGAAPLANETGARHLAVNVRITWPYRILTPDGLAAETIAAERDSAEFNLAISR